MEHGVDIIRAALECLHPSSALLESQEESAGRDGLARPAVHGGDHDGFHFAYPVMSHTGFCASISVRPPAGFERLTDIWVTSVS